jgi:asparagine synthase (glutamine-hydrolysing)
MHGENSKVALRRIAGKWLPKEILERPKQGFVLPMAKWLAQWFEQQASVSEYFMGRAVPGLKMNALAQLAEDDVSRGVTNERLLFALVLFVEWYQSFNSKQSELARRYREASAEVSVVATQSI